MLAHVLGAPGKADFVQFAKSLLVETFVGLYGFNARGFVVFTLETLVLDALCLDLFHCNVVVDDGDDDDDDEKKRDGR